MFSCGLHHVYLIDINVSVNGRDFNLMKIAYGVPQGTVIGRLIFLLFINDLRSVSKKVKFYLFAEDTNIYYKTDTPEKLAKKVNTELKYVNRWLDANKLSLNNNKTNYMISTLLVLHCLLTQQ